ncbi:putative P450 monooxygenase [Dissoconium aciculare CBS 342.82]|uniref:P450 monooxygenase n=1 Tax=Dissoconium aciculare CBS 342.82 TaxID=1314786 RepID=A0A6J3LVH0_9PEZI|nr:putative P450 monooxygenase [Dissoconium aciculare CBS 342.82]KAF1818617.1 putative P450 monooxygenase [Dissoconium aciculare CBS 342.82]
MVAGGRAPEEYRAAHERYGPVVRLGPQHVSLSDPAAIPVIYGVGSKFYKTDFYKTMAPMYGGKIIESMFTVRSNEQHKAIKAPVAAFFSMSNMRNYETYVDECTEIFISTMHELEGQTLELAEWLQWYAFDVIASVTFQRRFGFLEERKDINGMIHGIEEGLGAIKFLGQYPELDGIAKVIFRSLLRLLNRKDPLVGFLELCDEEIERYDAAPAEAHLRTDFLSQLRQKKGPIGPDSQHENLVNHLGNNLLAGSDTTGISLRACFYYVHKNPPVLEKLRSEISEFAASGRLSEVATLEETLKMPYLQAIMKEAMRLHPGVGFPLERKVPEGGATICGVSLPGDTIISMSAPVIHVDPSIFGKDAAQFRPERWLDGDEEQLKVMERSLLTFGYGARTCIGKNISIMEMGKFVTQILRQFDVEFVNPEKPWSTNAAWFWRQSGMLVTFRSRRD